MSEHVNPDLQPWIVLYRLHGLTEAYIWTCMAENSDRAVQQLQEVHFGAIVDRRVPGNQFPADVTQYIDPSNPDRNNPTILAHVSKEFAKLSGLAVECSAESSALDSIARLLDGREWDSGIGPEIAEIVRKSGRVVRDPDELEDDE